MRDARLMLAETLFEELVQTPHAARSARLTMRCAGDPELRRLVEELLRNDDSGMGNFLRAPVPTLPQRQPARIGRYEIVREIGRGGVGVVYEARQDHPSRTVALKVLDAGFASAETLRRFEHEAEILAHLQDTGIAQVYEAGVAEIPGLLGLPATTPWFAMERVDGEPITAFCDRGMLTLSQRLSLFVQVCQAVQHAHTKGVIHRDLKPSNVLAGVHGEQAFCKIIDFGIAKLTQPQRAADATLTQIRQWVGTPAYMSPEQAAGSRDIDTRSDVYALGVLLYELLAGVTPVDSRRLREAEFGEVQRLIREVEPPAPSARLAALSPDELAAIAARRAVGPSRLVNTLRGELDWIILRALEKDRMRRYDSPRSLAADVERYRSGEAVEAAPPSAAYRLRKFVRKHRAQVVSAAVVMVALAAGFIGVSAGWLRARQAEFAARADAQTARRESLRASEIKRFLTLMLEGIDPSVAQGRPETVLPAVTDDAIGRLEQGEITDPVIEAELRHTLGVLLVSLGDLDRAEAMVRAALALRTGHLGPRHPDTLASLDWLGTVLKDRARLDEAEDIMQQAVELRRSVLGAAHADTLTSLNNLGVVYQVQGRLAEAEEIFEQVLAQRTALFGAEHPDVLASRANYAFILGARGRSEEAEPILRDVLEKRRQVLGSDHPTTINILSTWASVLGQELGRVTEAEAGLREAVERSERVLGESHPDTLLRIANWAAALSVLRRFDEAEPLLRRAYERSRARFGLDHGPTLLAGSNLASVLNQLGRPAESEPLYREIVAALRATLGDSNPNTLAILAAFSTTLVAVGKPEEAEEVAREALAGLRRELSPSHPRTLQCAGKLAAALAAQQRFDEGEQELRAAQEILRTARPESEAERDWLDRALASLLAARRTAERPPGE